MLRWELSGAWQAHASQEPTTVLTIHQLYANAAPKRRGPGNGQTQAAAMGCIANNAVEAVKHPVQQRR